MVRSSPPRQSSADMVGNDQVKLVDNFGSVILVARPYHVKVLRVVIPVIWAADSAVPKRRLTIQVVEGVKVATCNEKSGDALSVAWAPPISNISLSTCRVPSNVQHGVAIGSNMARQYFYRPDEFV